MRTFFTTNLKRAKQMAKITALFLCFALLTPFLAGCFGSRTTQVTLSFIGQVDNKLEFEYTGNERTITVDTGVHSVNYDITYYNGADLLDSQPVETGTYSIKAVVNEQGYAGSLQIPFIVKKKVLTLTAESFVIDYTGNEFTPVLSEAPAIPNGVDYDVLVTFGVDGVYSETDPKIPGVYTVKFVLNADNYAGETIVDYTINMENSAAIMGLSLAMPNLEYNGNAKTVTVNGAGSYAFLGSPIVEYTLIKDSSGNEMTDEEPTTTAPINAGTYAVKVTFTQDGIHPLVLESTMTIVKKPVQITAQSQNLELYQTVEHVVNFVGEGILPDLNEVNVKIERVTRNGEVSYETVTETEMRETLGEYRVTFSVNHLYNFSGSTTATYFVKARLGNIRWSATEQQFGDNILVEPILDTFHTFVSMTFEGVGGTTYTKSETQPEAVGTYEITLTVLTDGIEEIITELFTITPRPLSYKVSDRVFYDDDAALLGNIVHNTYDETYAGQMPDLIATYTQIKDADGNEVSGTPTTAQPTAAGVYSVSFTVNDANFQQVGTVTATYTVIARPNLNPALEFSTVQYNGSAQAVSLIGMEELNEHQTVSISYQKTHQWLGAQHTGTAGNANNAYVAGGVEAVAIATPAAPSKDAPTEAGIYKVLVSITLDGLTETVELTYTIERKQVQVVNTNSTTAERSGNAVRVAGNNARGNSSGSSAVQLYFNIQDLLGNNEPVLNSVSTGTNYHLSPKRSAISMITIEALALVDDSESTFNKIEIRSTRAYGDNNTSSGVQNHFATTNNDSQIPANATVGTYKVTYYIDQPNYVGVTEVIFTITPRTGNNALPSGWSDTTQQYGNTVAVVPTTRAWQSIVSTTYESIDCDGVGCEHEDCEGIYGIAYPVSTELPTEIGSYRVTVNGLSDGVAQVWTTTLTITKRTLSVTASSKTEAYHLLEGAALEPVMGLDLVVANMSTWRAEAQLSMADFDITYKDKDGAETNFAPTLPGVYTATFMLKADKTSHYTMAAPVTATFTITARTGLISLPAVTYGFGGKAFSAVTQPFHTNINITYQKVSDCGECTDEVNPDCTICEGTGKIYGVETSEVPVSAGLYLVTLTCITDTVLETYHAYYDIVNIVDVSLPETVAYAASGTSYRNVLPNIVVGANETLIYTFHNEFYDHTLVVDMANFPSVLNFYPGIYTYTTVIEGFTAAAATAGEFTVVFANTWDAFEYGKYYFENVATDYRSINTGTVAISGTLMSMGNDKTFNYTERFKTSNPESPITFASYTANGSRQLQGIDARMAVQAHVTKEGVWNWKGGFAKNSGSVGSFGNRDNVPTWWTNYTNSTRETAPYAFEVGGSFSTGTAEDFANNWYINTSLLNNYNITSANTSNKGTLTRNATTGQYNFTFNFNTTGTGNPNTPPKNRENDPSGALGANPGGAENGVHNFNYARQINKYASTTTANYRNFTSLELSYSIDINGRITEVNTVDKYVMNTNNSASATATTTVTGRETIVYDTDYIIRADAKGNPVAEQRGDGTSLQALCPTMFVTGSSLSKTIAVNGGSGDYTYEITSDNHPFVSAVLDEDGMLTITKESTDSSSNETSGTITVKVTDNVSGAETTISIPYSARNLTETSACVAEGTLIAVYDPTTEEIIQVPVEQLKGGEWLLVWNMYTGTYDIAPMLFNDSEVAREFQIIHLFFSDGTDVKVIYEHGFWDFTLNQWVLLRDYNAADLIGHEFMKMTEDGFDRVRLIEVHIYDEMTTAWSPVTYAHLNFFVNGMLSMPGATHGLINIFDVDADTVSYIYEQYLADLETYGTFTYEEFLECLPEDIRPLVPEFIFDAVNGQYFKVSMGKGLLTWDMVLQLLDTYAPFIEAMLAA